VTKPNIIRQDEINVIFVRSELDDARLTPHEFRIYAHIARRSNCFASLESMADICQMSQATIKRVLASLKEKGMIDLISRPGTTHLISITPPRVWSDQTWANIELSRKVVLHGVERLEPSSQGATLDGEPSSQGANGSSQGATKDIPLRESHIKEGEEASDSADAAPEETAFPKSKAPVSHPKHSAPPPPTPKVKAPRPRDVLFDTMMEVCFQVKDASQLTEGQGGWIARAVAQVKKTQKNLTPEMIRQFAVNKRKKWADCPINPNTYIMGWEYVSDSSNSSEPDPFDNKPSVTLADINAKFGYGQASVMWAKRMREQGRMR